MENFGLLLIPVVNGHKSLLFSSCQSFLPNTRRRILILGTVGFIIIAKDWQGRLVKKTKGRKHLKAVDIKYNKMKTT